MDPLLLKATAIGFGVLLVSAARHKLVSRTYFLAVLADYRVMPSAFVRVAAWTVIGLESLLGCSWLLSAFLPAFAAATATATVALLSAYTLAIAVNLWRGRVFISCGCGLSSSRSGGQQLSWALVWRNLLLLVAAGTATLPPSARPLGAMDYVTLAATLPAIVLLFLATNQLLANAASISTWRRVRG